MNNNSDTKEYILRQASEHDVKFIRLWFCDILGRLKGFAINVEDLEDCIDKGVIFDGGAIEGLARQGESDTIATPDLIHWTTGLPKTRSGKIMRRILRKIAANEYENLGDTSTLADPSVVDSLIENRMNK